MTIFCERKYVKEIWDVHESMGVGINRNGQLISKKKINVPHLGEKWFNPELITSSIAMKVVIDKFRVTMNSALKKALFVHMPNRTVIFKQLENNVYGIDPRDPSSYMSKQDYNNKNIQMMNAVQDNLAYMSERQGKRVKAVKKRFKPSVHRQRKISR